MAKGHALGRHQLRVVAEFQKGLEVLAVVVDGARRAAPDQAEPLQEDRHQLAKGAGRKRDRAGGDAG